MLGSVVAAEQPLELEHGLSASATIVPAVEISDTAVQLLAQRLTQANSKFKALSSLSVQQTRSGSQVSCYDESREPNHLMESDSRSYLWAPSFACKAKLSILRNDSTQHCHKCST